VGTWTAKEVALVLTDLPLPLFAQKLICIKARPAVARYLVAVMNNKVVTLDVREDIRRGREPFGRIMQTAGALQENEELVLIAPFEPKPLYTVLARQGFAHVAKPVANGDWEVRFSRSAEKQAVSEAHPKSQAPAGPEKPAARDASGTVEVDARGLEPPGPLVTILEAVAALPDGARLRAFTDRRPMHLYAQLEERGFTGESEQQRDGSFVTYVQRR